MARMQGLWLLLTDESGRVTWHAGAPPGHTQKGQHAALGVRGVHWREALGKLLPDASLPAEFPERFTCLKLWDNDGRALRLWLAPRAENARGGGVIVLEGGGSELDVGQQRAAAIGTVAAGVAHEMNNLLTLASGWLELALTDETLPDERLEPVRRAAEAVGQLSNLTNSLLDLSRARGTEVCLFDLNDLVRQVAELVDYQLEKDNIHLTAELCAERVPVEGSKAQLSQALLNLILNARQAMPQGGSIRLCTARTRRWSVVRVADTGCGIPRQLQKRVFEPFFSSRRKHGGTGLGLVVSKHIAERHGGSLRLASKPGVGTTVTLRLPTAKESVRIVGG